ncbi:E3 ubiquitin-protein ligase TRIM11-like [Pelobates fuscus]|uniref:E3 ubiquitin-protein ligase TRIM11-like n=1 Tax=Pelobates fuscus TaxID=191477 RepID=UPI002FE44FC0
MASAEQRYEVTCSICVEVYIDPVTLTCGHSFCRGCIEKVLETQKRFGAHTCPECRMRIQEPVILEKDDELYKKVEDLLSTLSNQVFCTYCINAPVPAAKTCMLCDASLCDNHLRVHSSSVEHVLIEPNTSIDKMKCPIHRKVLEFYCCDQALCVSCTLTGHHMGHQAETLLQASEKKIEKLRNILDKLNPKRDGVEKEVQSLQKHKRDVQEKTSGIAEKVSTLITNIKKQLEDLEQRVLGEISRQEEQVSLQVWDLIQQLEIKKEEMSRKMGHIEELCTMTDTLAILHERESDRIDYCEADNDDNNVHALRGLDLGLILLTLHTGLADIVTGTMRKNKVTITSDTNPDTTTNPIQSLNVYMDTDIFLDVNTASNDVTISSDLKTVSRTDVKQCRPDGHMRFESPQVLSLKHFTSRRHYWKVKTSKSANWMVGMAYISIDKKGDQSWLGSNAKSWGLERWKGQYSAMHNSNDIQLPQSPSCNKLWIYLDYEAGLLSFYEQGLPARHLHTFTAAFTEPLHVLLCVGTNSWVRIAR